MNPWSLVRSQPRAVHLVSHPLFRDGQSIGIRENWESKMCQTGCHTRPVSLGHRLLPTTGSRAKVMEMRAKATRNFTLSFPSLKIQ